jgi:hypothetical protein
MDNLDLLVKELCKLPEIHSIMGLSLICWKFADDLPGVYQNKHKLLIQ